MTYYCTFIGRRAGAIGITHHCREFVEAPDKEAARIKLYTTHEHIQGLSIVEAWSNQPV